MLASLDLDLEINYIRRRFYDEELDTGVTIYYQYFIHDRSYNFVIINCFESVHN